MSAHCFHGLTPEVFFKELIWTMINQSAFYTKFESSRISFCPVSWSMGVFYINDVSELEWLSFLILILHLIRTFSYASLIFYLAYDLTQYV